MIFHIGLRHCLAGLVSFLIPVHLFYLLYPVAYGRPSLASIPLAMRGSSLALTCIDSIWLLQYWLRPDWRPWGILLVSAANLVVIVMGYLSLKWDTPLPKQMTWLLATTAPGAILQVLQAGLVIWLYVHPSRSYEPLVKDTAVTPFWSRSSLPVLDHEATCGQPPNYSKDPLGLDSLYQAHQRRSKENAGRFLSKSTHVSRLYFKGKTNIHAEINR